MSFFFKKDQEIRISPYEKEQKISQVISMFPLLSRDHFLYSTLERNNWSLDTSIPTLQRRHEYLEAEQYQIERRLADARAKKEQEQRERERERRLINQVKEIFGVKFSEHQISRALYDYRNNVEDTINHFMKEIDREQDRERQRRQQRLDEEDRLARQRERDEFERQERNKKRVNDLLLEIKYSTPEQKRELANTRLFQDVIKDFDRLLEPEVKTIYVPVPTPQPTQPPSHPNHFNNYPIHSSPPPIYNHSPAPSNFLYNKPPTGPGIIIQSPVVPVVQQPNQPFQVLDPFQNTKPNINNRPMNPFNNNNFDCHPTNNNNSISTLINKPEPTVNPSLLKELKQMFPDTTDEIIKYVLLSSDGNVTLAIQNLLDITIKVEKNKQLSN